jgi:branched-chain amino acid transport system substrate-binding protein
MKKGKIGVGLAIFAAVICGVLIYSRPAFLQTKPKIAAILALTGSGADWGQTALNSIKLALQDNGNPFDLLTENAPAEEVDRSVSALRRVLASQKPYAIIGPTWDDVAAAFAPVIDREKVVTLAPDASSGVERDRDFPFWFSLFSPEKIEMDALASFLRARKSKTAVTIYNQDPFSQQLRDSFVAAAQKAGINIVADLPIADAETRDFRTQLLRAKALLPDAIFIEFADQNAKGPLMRQAKELDVKTTFVSSATTDTQSTLDQFGSILDGLTFAAPKVTAEYEKFSARYKTAYGSAPSAPSAGPAYDAVKLLISAWAAGKRTSEEVQSYLLLVKNFHGVSASDMSFSPTGRIVWPASAYEIKTIRNGQVANIE